MALWRKINPTLFVLTFLIMFCLAAGRPYHREKRSGISDQRLAEIETLIAMSKYARNRAKEVTSPIAFGVFDPTNLGKRKRSYGMSSAEGKYDEQFPQLYTFPTYNTEKYGNSEPPSLLNTDLSHLSSLDILHLWRLFFKLQIRNENQLEKNDKLH
ncbi:uncharacterized protein LOC111088310 [Limulus polyphemus]|uniref:Uncharacterized protein LOC111088310 n=1 Tax=Limulus polyphemus TaxID=6850 RepID=A0ABM1TCZ2_LIMPO|nr:uncharacterized protein LOC111088310 [Limulus polyphemus]